MQTLLQPGMSDPISNSIATLIENRPKAHETTRQRLQAGLRETELKSNNLLEAIELSKAGSTRQDILRRLEALEGEKNDLSSQVAALGAQNASSSDLTKSGQLAVEFASEFNDLFASAPIEERKILLRKCISRIVVDRERGMVRFGVWLIPAVTSEIEALYANKTALATRVASAASSGDRT